MKQKYYLRGIGVGILFASIVLFVAYLASGRGRMTDEEVIRRAEELGMVTTESVLSGLDTPSVSGSTEEIHSRESSSSDAISDSGSEESSDLTEDIVSETTTEVTTKATTETTTEATTETTTEKTENGTGKVTFTVVSGMDSYSVAKVLEDRGVIRDALDFDNYLEQNGYSGRIATGEYSVQKGADYETIARMLTGGN